MLRIAVIGTGDVGFTLAKGWASKGYSVTIGTRDPTSEKVYAVCGALQPRLLIIACVQVQKLVADIGFGVTALEGGEAALSAVRTQWEAQQNRWSLSE
jgi:predicted dinucleotide-binding enzyme